MAAVAGEQGYLGVLSLVEGMLVGCLAPDWRPQLLLLFGLLPLLAPMLLPLLASLLNLALSSWAVLG